MAQAGLLSLKTGKKDIQVAIALVERDGAWLVSQRAAGRVFAGLWEFPGGKIEPGESPAGAAVRETREETCLEIEAVGELGSIVTDYPDHRVILHLVLCRCVNGEPSPGDDSVTEVCWVSWTQLQQLEMPAANAEIIARLSALIERRTRDTA